MSGHQARGWVEMLLAAFGAFCIYGQMPSWRGFCAGMMAGSLFAAGWDRARSKR